MRLRIAAAALAIGLCTAGVASADEVPPEFQNRPTQADCYNAVPTIVGSGVIFGGPGPDVIVGSNGPDVIYGLTGADIILGLGDNDVIYGGQGDDLVCAGAGADYVQGGGDRDTVYGEPGKDNLFGGDGEDLLSGDLHPDDYGDGQAGLDFCTPSTENPVSCP
ncbi:calcium-binding protein [Lentzea sp. NPDC058436]|uniref:calcium-binding protein n=1 Tax=Lentzea sp. NPDC058436 TaxID=3346499 RepID=UPI0036605E2B